MEIRFFFISPIAHPLSSMPHIVAINLNSLFLLLKREISLLLLYFRVVDKLLRRVSRNKEFEIKKKFSNFEEFPHDWI